MPSLMSPSVGFAGSASDLYSTPFPHKLGEKARDQFGNEYIFVNYAVTGMQWGSVVVFDSNFQASPLNSASAAGRVGVVPSLRPTTDQAGWVQIYGFAPFVQASTGTASTSDVSDTSTLRIPYPVTITASPVGAISFEGISADATSETKSSVEVNEIMGLWLAYGETISDHPQFTGSLTGTSAVSDSSGSVTNTTAQTTDPAIGNALVACFLNYPYHLNVLRTVRGFGSS